MQVTERHGYTVTYESSSHWKVMTQMWGSVWPKVRDQMREIGFNFWVAKASLQIVGIVFDSLVSPPHYSQVLPYCLLNVLIMGIIEWFDVKDSIALAVSDKGHSFMNLLVAFLVVSRVNISIGRYNEARGYLSVMYRESRELIQNVVALTSHNTDVRAKEWRNNVAYKSCILLRVAMGVVDYDDRNVNVWDLPELDNEERSEIQKFIFYDTGGPKNALRWSHGIRTEYEENMRVPIQLAYLLRKEVRRNRSELGQALETPQELKVLSSIDAFMVGYYGMRKFLTTPVPFPLIQMARTFVFFYVYTVPFALLSDSSSPIAHCVVIFILTYGFMGLEYVSIELDNPFGEDANDFDNLGMAETAFEDTYLTILQCDGPQWTDRLRQRMYRSERASGTGTNEIDSLLEVI